jgi:hypothetical protein
VNLLSLEVSTSGEERRGAQPGETHDADALAGTTRVGGDETPEAPAAPAATETLELPGGLLVDVLA